MFSRVWNTLPQEALIGGGGGPPPPLPLPYGDEVKIFEDLQTVLDVAFAIFIFIAKLNGLGYMPIGIATVGVSVGKGIFKAVEMKLDQLNHRVKNGADKAMDILTWIEIVTNTALGTFVLIGQEKAFLFSLIALGLSCGTKVTKVITKRTIGKLDDRFSSFR